MKVGTFSPVASKSTAPKKKKIVITRYGQNLTDFDQWQLDNNLHYERPDITPGAYERPDHVKRQFNQYVAWYYGYTQYEVDGYVDQLILLAQRCMWIDQHTGSRNRRAFKEFLQRHGIEHKILYGNNSIAFGYKSRYQCSAVIRFFDDCYVRIQFSFRNPNSRELSVLFTDSRTFYQKIAPIVHLPLLAGIQ